MIKREMEGSRRRNKGVRKNRKDRRVEKMRCKWKEKNDEKEKKGKGRSG